MNTKELLQRLAQIDPAALADVNKQIRTMSSALRPVQSGLQLLGPAYTVRCNDDFFAVIAALAEAQPGDVLVIDTQGSDVAVVGELFSLEAERRGLAGIVIDGACRDVTTIRQLSMPVYARASTPVSGTVNDLGERNIAVQCGGVTVRPGEIVFGDDDGIVVGSNKEFAELITAAEEIKKVEQAVIARMSAGDSLISLLNYTEHRDSIESGNTSTLKFSL